MTQPNLIDAAAVRASVAGLAAQLAADPKPGIVRPKVMTRLVGNLTSESRFTQYDKTFTFRCDEAVERGGRAEEPSPMRYLLSGVAFCLQVWYAKGAAFAECALESLEIDLESFLDMRGEHLIAGVPPNPQYLTMEVRVGSTSPAETVLQMIDDGDRRCPLSNLVALAVPIYQRVVHNGQVIRDTVPADHA
jgi:uncharacterized OsmC-like protein